MKQVLIIATFLSGFFAFAQQQPETYRFTLQQAISHALEHNYAALNASRDIDIAKQKKWETTSSGLPQINASAGYVDNFKLQQSVIPAEFFGGTPGQFVTVAFGTRHTANAAVTLSQKIFDGSYIVALQASKTYLQYYQNAKQKSNLEVREMVINAYGNVLLAEESIAILESNREILEKTLNDTRETYKNGLAEEETVEQLQITLTTVNSNLNNTRRLLDISKKMLKVSLGIDINADIELTDKLEDLTVSNMDLSLTQGGFSVKDNVDYQIAENFRDQKRLEYKLERSKALPTLSANVNLGANTFANTFTLFQTDNKWYDYSNFGLSLNVPIFSSFGRRSRTQQAGIALEQAKTQLVEAEQKLRLQYEQAKSEYDFSIEQYNTAKENLRLAERIENKQQVKFTEGLSTSFEFADAQRQLYDAQQQFLQSMIDIINKKAALEKVTNKQ